MIKNYQMNGANKMKYDIVETCIGHNELTKLVNERIKLGWEPIGGPIISGNNCGNRHWYQAYQAMIKNIEK